MTTTQTDPRYPDVQADVEPGGDFDILTFRCPWGCREDDGTPKKHIHGARGQKGGPVLYGGATSHCRQPGAPSWYRLVPRDGAPGSDR